MKIHERVEGLEMEVSGTAVAWRDRGEVFAMMGARDVMRSNEGTFPDFFIACVRCPDSKIVKRYLMKHRPKMAARFNRLRTKAVEACKDAVTQSALHDLRHAVRSALEVTSTDLVTKTFDEEMVHAVHDS